MTQDETGKPETNGHTPITRDGLLALTTLAHEDVIVPGLAAPVRVSEMTMTDRDAFDESCQKQVAGKSQYTRENVRAKLIVYTAVDADGKRLFTAADVPAVGRLGTGAMQALVDAAMRVNKMTVAEIEATEKNSDAAPSGAR